MHLRQHYLSNLLSFISNLSDFTLKMTILPKKKTGKDKGTAEQGNHDHHATAHHTINNIPENRGRHEVNSVRATTHSNSTTLEERHRSNRILLSNEFVTLPNPADGSVTVSSHNASYEETEVVTSCVGDTNTLHARVQQTNSDPNDITVKPATKHVSSDIACTSAEAQPLIAKRRHGRLSPHAQPYTRTKPTRCSVTITDSSASCSSTASTSSYYHSSRRHLTVEDRRPISPSVVVNSNNSSRRRRQRSRTEGKEERGENNSDDEHDTSRLRRLNQGIDFDKLEIQFARALKEIRGFHIKAMVEDGACLFRAVAEQVYGDQNMHDEVRRSCMDYMMKNSDFFSNYITEDFVTYIHRKRLPDTHGNHLEMQAMAELYNRCFEVYQYTTEPINTFQTSNLNDNDPLRVSYHRNSHYNAVINPYKASVGVGLGLPSFRPGLADRMLLQDAQRSSEQELLEAQMLEDKLRAADWENTEDEMIRAVAQESFVDYLHQQKEFAKEKRDCASEGTEVGGKQPTCSHDLPTTPFIGKTDEDKSELNMATTSNGNSYAQSFGNPALGDWVDENEENNILAQVMAQSHREYYDTLTRCNKHDGASSSATCSKYASSQ